MALRYSLQDTDGATSTRAVPIAPRYVPPRLPPEPGAAVTAFQPLPILADPRDQLVKERVLEMLRRRRPVLGLKPVEASRPVVSAPVSVSSKLFNQLVHGALRKREKAPTDELRRIIPARESLRNLTSNPLADIMRRRGTILRGMTSAEYNQLVNTGRIRVGPNALGWAQGPRWKERMPNVRDRRPLLREGAVAESTAAPGTDARNASPSVPASVAASAAGAYFNDTGSTPTVAEASQADPVGGGLLLLGVGAALMLL